MRNVIIIEDWNVTLHYEFDLKQKIEKIEMHPELSQ
jgi:hypothetical protein